MRIGTATREGTDGPTADATAVSRSTATGRRTAAALVVGMGHDAEIVRRQRVLGGQASIHDRVHGLP
ncbi:hypothetical protein [Embleya sp. AB8]|uniref:hypothetical protein n=1 Tax=Embleya sp. AB8 TaxID=3156304 RepID=UPI003C72E6F9